MSVFGRTPIASTCLGLFAGVLLFSPPPLRAAEPPKVEAVPAKNPLLPPPDLRSAPKGAVLVEVFEHTNRADGAPLDWGSAEDKNKFQGFSPSWGHLPPARTQSWLQRDFALAHLPPKYNARGLREERSVPFVVRLSAMVTLPAGTHELLLRAIKGSRLVVDGSPQFSTPITQKILGPPRASDAEAVPDQLALQLVKAMALLKPGHTETIGPVHSDGSPRLLSFEFFVGGKNLRPEPGAPVVSLRDASGSWSVLRPQLDGPALTDAAWTALVKTQRSAHEDMDHALLSPAAEKAFWDQRHETARAALSAVAPKHSVPAAIPVERMIDTLLLEARGALPLTARTTDAAFLRRATFDATGLPPSAAELAAFLADPSPDKRARALDRLLAGPAWAHQWVPYWQDVLAENPSILKATLNNSGPFRWFLYDALRDNWPADRFATALISMEGSVLNGGAGGFSTSSQNDLPMAHKAQILASGFLAMEMKCARCHDAPTHPVEQGELFALSAMLKRDSFKVPETSLTKGLKANSHVTVTLKAGEVIRPEFPLSNFAKEPLPGALRNPGDTREQLASILTDPRNPRFAQVLANRLWKRLMGWAFIEPVDDWDAQVASHPALLEWLGRQLVELNYDMKLLARRIMLSDAYQRQADPDAFRQCKPAERLFAAPSRRRLSAEQILDSVFFMAGKAFESEPLNFDLDGRRTVKDFLSLGEPERAWQLVGLSNERDRPSLAKPVAQALADVLRVNGWRESRAEPRTAREDAPDLLQPALLANGVIGSRIVRLSEDSAFTALALEAASPEAFARALYLRVLNREPAPQEQQSLAEFVREGFAGRVVPCKESELARKPRFTKAVMWSNHLHPDSTTAIYEAEALLRAGDPPTKRLVPQWRERAEDAVWALLLTPEFSFLP